jgi:two-component system OmpR family response regulator
MRILIAEDDSILADGLVRSLRQSAYAVDHVKSGVEADTALSMQSFDLLILDLGLPRMSGLEVLRRLRARNSNLPVLILTAADSVDERVKGLDLGADDYMAKPFALSELGLLEVLLQRIGRLVSKEQLVDHLCEWGEEVSNNAIEVYVHRLRKKIEPSGVRIITVRGLGYCLEKATSATAAAAASDTHTPSSTPSTPEPSAPASPASAAMPASHHFK